MSVCGQSGQTEEESGAEEVTTATATTTAAVRTKKPPSKVVRVLTVLAYLLSVSLAAILLSVYYVCVWKSPELPPLNGSGAEHNAQRAHRHALDYMPAETLHNFTGGSDSGVSAAQADPAITNTNVFPETNTTEASTTYPTEVTNTAATPLNNSLYFDTNYTDTDT